MSTSIASIPVTITPNAGGSLAALIDRLRRQSVTEDLDNLGDELGQVGLSIIEIVAAVRKKS